MRPGKTNDYMLIILTVLLLTFGAAILGSASSNLSKIKLGDTWYYLKHQFLYGGGLGIIGFFIGSVLYYRRYEKFAIIGMIIALVLLALAFTPLAFEIKGAARWVQIGPLTFQPSEVLKLFFIIYLAAWLAGSRDQNRQSLKGFMAFLVILGLVMGLLLKQPATSAAVILAVVAMSMYFVSGSRVLYLFVTGFLLVAVLGLSVYFTPYRWARVQTFFNSGQNEQGSGYQVSQAKIAIGSGGLWGIGYGQSVTKINHLPEPLADSIFAIVGEEFGFVGSVVLIGLLLALILRLFFIAHRATDQFGRLILVGFGSLIALQSFVNIAAISGILPLTGTPLPFISYGGTALAVYLTMIGVANNISKYSY